MNAQKKPCLSNLEQLIEDMPRIIRGIAPNQYNAFHNDDDIRSAVSIAIARAVQWWRPDGGTTFNSYAIRCSLNELRTVARRERRHELGRVELTIDIPAPIRKYTIDDIDELDFALGGVVGRPRRVLIAFADGMTFKQIAAVERGLTAKSVARLVRSTLAVLQARADHIME